jgi:fumarylacetoacetase
MTPYGRDNLPYGVFSRADGVRRIGVRLDDSVLDLAAALDDVPELRQPTLNPFLALGRPRWTAVRERVADVIGSAPLIPLTDVTLHRPFEVADYTDFYSSEHHVRNAGHILRPQNPGLQPNWRRLPVGYHGRSGTVVVSGTPIARPYGQLGDGVVGPTAKLDIEAEVGFVVGVGGRLITTDRFAEHVFGVVLVNDWSARDIQAFENRPLGPFLSKSFATSISPWVVPLEALATVAPPVQDPPPAAYLQPPGTGFDLRLTVDWNGTRVAEPPFASMYWTPAQQLAHLTSNGASVRTGDLFASGTVTGPDRAGQAGSLMELTWNGTEPVTLADGSVRGWLADGDTITIGGTTPGRDGPIGLGEVTGTVQYRS